MGGNDERRRCSRGDGRVAKRRGLCAACYALAPRVLAAPGESVQLPPVRVSRALAEQIRAAAARASVELTDWRRAAYERQLRTGRGRP